MRVKRDIICENGKSIRIISVYCHTLDFESVHACHSVFESKSFRSARQEIYMSLTRFRDVDI